MSSTRTLGTIVLSARKAQHRSTSERASSHPSTSSPKGQPRARKAHELVIQRPAHAGIGNQYASASASAHSLGNEAGAGARSVSARRHAWTCQEGAGRALVSPVIGTVVLVETHS